MYSELAQEIFSASMKPHDGLQVYRAGRASLCCWESMRCAFRGGALPTLAQIYEEHANECLRSAVRADDPKQRDMLLRLASAWREDAEALKRGQELHKLASAWRKAKALRRVAEGVSRVAPAPAGPRKA